MACSAAGKLFQTRGPATANDLSPSHVLVQSGFNACLELVLIKLLNGKSGVFTVQFVKTFSATFRAC